MKYFLSLFPQKNNCLFVTSLFLLLASAASGQSRDSLSHKPIVTSDGIVYEYVDKMPEFPGGQSALIRYLSQHTHYPPKARRKNRQGTVLVQFVVGNKGKTEDVKTIGKKIGSGLEKEAMQVVKNMPRWTPGEQKGKKVRVQYTLPIRFKLTQTGKKRKR